VTGIYGCNSMASSQPKEHARHSNGAKEHKGNTTEKRFGAGPAIVQFSSLANFSFELQYCRPGPFPRRCRPLFLDDARSVESSQGCGALLNDVAQWKEDRYVSDV